MNRIALSLLTLFVPTMKAEPKPKSEPNLNRLILVIAEIEQGRWGEQGGICNMHYQAWTQHSKFSYRLSASREHALPIYRQHLETLANQLRLAKRVPSVLALVTCWRYGFDGARLRNFTCDEGQRATNLYEDASFDKPIP